MTPGTTCIPNIGPKQRQRRIIGGIVMSAVAVGVFAALLAAGAGRWWRLALFLPLYGAGLGYFQAYERTCIALAARGQRNLDHGTEAIDGGQELERVRQQARLVQRKALASAAVLTALAVVVWE